MEVAKLVLALLASGGSGAAAWALFGWLQEVFPAIEFWPTLGKRAIAWMLCIVLVAALFGIAVGMEWTPAPETWRAWLNVVADYSLVAISVSQAAHAVKRDRDARKAAAHT